MELIDDPAAFVQTHSTKASLALNVCSLQFSGHETRRPQHLSADTIRSQELMHTRELALYTS